MFANTILNNKGFTSKYCLFALGIMVANTGPMFNWNVGLGAGIGTYSLVIFIGGFGYVCLCLCTAELSSAFPFAGGSYGLARCTVGYFLGFLVGSFEIIFAFLSVAFGMSFLSNLLLEMYPTRPELLPLYLLPLYGAPLIITSVGKQYFWMYCVILSLYTTAIVWIYLFSSLSVVNITKYGDTISPFHDDFICYLRLLPLGLFMYLGPEIMNLFCNEVENGRSDVPWAQMWTILFMFIQTLPVFFITASAPPGIMDTAATISPVASRFHETLGLSLNTAYLITMFIPLTGTFSGYVIAFAKLMGAMAESQLLPSLFRWQDSEGQYFFARIFGLVVCFCINLIVIYVDEAMPILLILFNMSAFSYWIPQLVGYVILKMRMRMINRAFESPLGLAGAGFALVIFTLGFVSTIGFQPKSGFGIVAYFVIIFLASAYYFLVGRHNQVFSEEEKSIMFDVHVELYEMVGPREKIRKIIPGERNSSVQHAVVSFSTNGVLGSAEELRECDDEEVSTADVPIYVPNGGALLGEQTATLSDFQSAALVALNIAMDEKV